MNEPFILEVTYQSKALELPAAFQRYGFTYRIAVEIEGAAFMFEPDEEGSYRVLGQPAEGRKFPEAALLEAVISKLQQLA